MSDPVTPPECEPCPVDCPGAGKWGATGRLPAGHHRHPHPNGSGGYLAHGDPVDCPLVPDPNDPERPPAHRPASQLLRQGAGSIQELSTMVADRLPHTGLDNLARLMTEMRMAARRLEDAEDERRAAAARRSDRRALLGDIEEAVAVLVRPSAERLLRWADGRLVDAINQGEL